jgi:hypothetical protein
MNILDLFAHIGLKADTGVANDFLKTITGTQGQLLKVISSTLSFATAIKVMNSAFNDALGLAKFEQNTGMSSEAMQRWTQVADQVNGSGQSVAATLDAIAANQEKIKFGEGSIKGYQLLGIDPKQNPIDILEQIRIKSAGLSNEMRRNIAQEFGVSRDLVATLELTNDQFDKMSQNAFVIPESSIQGLMQARAELVQLKNQIKYMLDESVVKTLPLIQTVVKWIEKSVTSLQNAGTMINKIVQSTIGWKAAIVGLVGVIAVLNASLIATPIGLVSLAIGALLLILDDLYVYTTGKGKSIFGFIVDKFPKVGESFKWLIDLVAGLVDIFKYIFSGNLSAFDDMVERWNKWGGILKTVSEWLTKIKDFFDDDETGKKKSWLDKFKDFSENGLNALLMANPLTAPFAAMKNLATSLFVGGAKKDSKSAGNTSSTTTNTNTFTITVSGADNPDATATAIEEHAQKKLNGVQANRTGSKDEK